MDISTQRNFTPMPNSGPWDAARGTPSAVKRFRVDTGGSTIGNAGGFEVGASGPVMNFPSMPQVHITLAVRPTMPSGTARGGRINHTADIDRYQFLFVKKNAASKNAKVSDPEKVGVTLQVLNYLLHQWTVDGEVPDDSLLTGTKTAGTVVPSDPDSMIPWIVRTWGLAGVINSEKGEGARTNGVRVLTVVRMGRYDLPNMYGPGVLGGNQLFLMVKFVPVSGTSTPYVFNSNEAPKYLPNTTRFPDGTVAPISHVAQIVGSWTAERSVPLNPNQVHVRYKVRENGSTAANVLVPGYGVIKYQAKRPGKLPSDPCEEFDAYVIPVAQVETNHFRKHTVAEDANTNVVSYLAANKIDALLHIAS